MPIARTEFSIEPDLVFPESGQVGTLVDTGDLVIELRNGSTDHECHVIELIGAVTGPVTDLKDAANEQRGILAQWLDVLALVTRARFTIIRPIRSVEWESRKVERRLFTFVEQDARYPPEPALADDLLQSVRTISQMDLEPYAWKALKYFRYGLLEGSSEDQFVRFWHALEIMAENLKTNEQVPITCRHCHSPLVCSCGTPATRFPMAKQAIDELIAQIAGKKAEEVSKRFFEARNTLMHGGRPESVEKKIGRPMVAVVNELASLTWHTLMRSLPNSKEEELALAQRTDVSNGVLTVRGHILFQHNEDSDHPALDKIPDVKTSILNSFKDFG
ncbi:hypothetical protein X739_01340 [Mesorhizobium sp. LNHC220B00]|nr:hypothetical protein [Mesorhizobium sp. LNHC220B00]ESY77863.1 hypothetical protein X741_34420 [Mesorhizobium sp. LNHC229A00]ESY89079.1 hypothetical protein X739_01340 [Mesorhizobium sp. LNHC220B00]